MKSLRMEIGTRLRKIAKRMASFGRCVIFNFLVKYCQRVLMTMLLVNIHHFSCLSVHSQDNWDDDDTNDDFAQQLRQLLESTATATATSTSANTNANTAMDSNK